MRKETNFREDLTQLRHNQLFLAIAILFLASVFIWVGLEMFGSQKSTRITPQQKKLAEPLSPVLDITVVDGLAARPYFSTADLNNFEIYKLVTLEDGNLSRAIPIGQDPSSLEPSTPSPSPIIVPAASASAQPPTN
jgi:hypothetical protein